MLTNEDTSLAEQIWQHIAELGSWRRAKLLSLLPELDSTGSGLLLLHRLGLRRMERPSLRSAWIDLRIEAAQLRSSLNGKWRNMLSFGERANLELLTDTSDESFDWMLSRYEELMKEKNFEGPTVPFLRALRANATANEPLIVLRALLAGEVVAGICIAVHGSSATYLLGWNGTAGRAVKAHHFLLWNGICHLRTQGVQWLDVGGIETERNPSISAFKLGMNGKEYQLAGEYVGW